MSFASQSFASPEEYLTLDNVGSEPSHGIVVLTTTPVFDIVCTALTENAIQMKALDGDMSYFSDTINSKLQTMHENLLSGNIQGAMCQYIHLVLDIQSLINQASLSAELFGESLGELFEELLGITMPKARLEASPVAPEYTTMSYTEPDLECEKVLGNLAKDAIHLFESNMDLIAGDLEPNPEMRLSMQQRLERAMKMA